MRILRAATAALQTTGSARTNSRSSTPSFSTRSWISSVRTSPTAPHDLCTLLDVRTGYSTYTHCRESGEITIQQAKKPALELSPVSMTVS